MPMPSLGMTKFGTAETEFELRRFRQPLQGLPFIDQRLRGFAHARLRQGPRSLAEAAAAGMADGIADRDRQVQEHAAVAIADAHAFGAVVAHEIDGCEL